MKLIIPLMMLAMFGLFANKIRVQDTEIAAWGNAVNIEQSRARELELHVQALESLIPQMGAYEPVEPTSRIDI